METIQSLAEYVEEVVGLNTMTVFNRDLSGLSLYRGQADSSWGLVPKVYRDNRFQNEYALIQEFDRLRPDEFAGLSYIEKLIKMQHYGLPTRLLDFSENPLVALYFACESVDHMTKDGIVYALCGYPVNHQDSLWVSIMSKALFEYGSRIHIPSFIDSLKNEPTVYKTNGAINFYNEKEILRILTIQSLGVHPKLYNQRIKQQSGAFLIFGMEHLKKDGEHHIFSEIKPKAIEELWKPGRAYIIPANKKEQILFELDKIGINKRTIYPELEHTAEYIDERINKYNYTNMGIH